MNLFKNFKTKKQLRAEIEKLKEIQRHMEYKERNPVFVMERNIQRFQGGMRVSYEERDIPEEIIKRRIGEIILEQVQPLIEYDFMDDGHGGKWYTGYLYVGEK